MKKLTALLLAVLMLVSLTACGGGSDNKDAKYTVGVVQLVPHVALDAATQGFVDRLTEILGEENVDIQVEIAAGDSATCAPIVTDSVTEYGVAMGISNFNGTVGGNVSGTSDLADLEKQAAMVQEWFPDAKTVGLLYCSAEPNSQYQVDTVQAFLEGMGFTCKQYPFADSNDMAAVTTDAAANSDVIYVPTDNAVAAATGIIDGICQPAGVPVIAGEEGICAGCGVATLSISYYDLGCKTAEMAAQILTGEADISTMAIAYADNITPKYNAAICEALGITPMEGYEPIA